MQYSNICQYKHTGASNNGGSQNRWIFDGKSLKWMIVGVPILMETPILPYLHHL